MHRGVGLLHLFTGVLLSFRAGASSWLGSPVGYDELYASPTQDTTISDESEAIQEHEASSHLELSRDVGQEVARTDFSHSRIATGEQSQHLMEKESKGTSDAEPLGGSPRVLRYVLKY